MAHADLVGLREAERGRGAAVRPVLAHAVFLAADIAGGLLDQIQEAGVRIAPRAGAIRIRPRALCLDFRRATPPRQGPGRRYAMCYQKLVETDRFTRE